MEIAITLRINFEIHFSTYVAIGGERKCLCTLCKLTHCLVWRQSNKHTPILKP